MSHRRKYRSHQDLLWSAKSLKERTLWLRLLNRNDDLFETQMIARLMRMPKASLNPQWQNSWVLWLLRQRLEPIQECNPTWINSITRSRTVPSASSVPSLQYPCNRATISSLVMHPAKTNESKGQAWVDSVSPAAMINYLISGLLLKNDWFKSET